MKVFRSSLVVGLLGLFAVSLATFPAFAGNNLIGNGFPSGPHYNLNIIGKKDQFICPLQADYLASTPDQNVIYVWRYDSDIEILMESGAKGPKNAPSLATLKVTDWCSNNIDGTPAVLQLPADPDGYAVYARITGKPGSVDQNGNGLPSFAFTDRDFTLVEDEFGNDLFGLGLITPTGIVDFAGNELFRFDGSRKGKGVKQATNITELFQFSGDVCAINDQTTFCSDGSCTVGPVVCCVPVQDDGSGGLQQTNEGCTDPDLLGFAACEAQVEVMAGVFACDGENIFDGATTTNVCEVTTQCKTFADQWIFNIADFVNALFGADNNGSYNVQFRFYPLPLQNNQTP